MDGWMDSVVLMLLRLLAIKFPSQQQNCPSKKKNMEAKTAAVKVMEEMVENEAQRDNSETGEVRRK